MTRESFIEQLENKLRGELDQASVKENVQYYNNYISDEINNGKSEAEILESLGDPWAIAKSIIQAQEGANGFRSNTVVDEHGDEGTNSQSRGKTSKVKFHNINISVWKILFFIIALLFVIVLAIVIFARIVIAFAPIIIGGIIILLAVRYLGNR